MRRLPLLVALVALMDVGLAARADAQFETANRQFHNQTSFPLDGRHRDLPCESCHRQGVYKGTPAKCFDCHWTRRQDDRYRLQLGAQCEQCHRTSSWTAVRWEHGAMTGMALSAAHRTLSCQSCHSNNTFRAAQTTCLSCHQKDYQSARTPNHLSAGFPTTCEACHKPSDASFHEARFDHTSFPLLGVHAQQMCATCHKGSVYVGTPRDCVGCHRTDYDRTTTPSHVASGFSTACESCHRATDPSFKGANLNHASVYALVGVHAQQTCARCHGSGVYKGTPRICVGCHLDAYNRTTNPNHIAAGFPTTCDSCHRNTDTLWTQGTFNHRFPITSGPHRVACTQCHTGGSFQTFNCLSCHGRTETDGHHRSIAGYRYDSLACYSCHPNGRH